MGRPLRTVRGGLAYHVLNRGNRRMTIFEKEADYQAFRRILREALERIDVRLCAYCVMPNHFHLVVWPRRDRELSQFMAWLTLTHTQRWQAHRQAAGLGHVYQGRFRSFPIQENDHFASVCRYVERNALRARLVSRAQDWPWSSLHQPAPGKPIPPEELVPLSGWPIPQPRRDRWLELVNEPQSQTELDALRQSVGRGRPYGSESWSHRVAGDLGLESTFRPRGRPRKPKGASTNP